MDYVDSLTLVAAAIERAAKDTALREACPFNTGHGVHKCATSLMQGLREYARQEAPLKGDELAVEFMRLVYSG